MAVISSASSLRWPPFITRRVQTDNGSEFAKHLDDFNRKPMDYLIWYNTEKPHRGIGKVPPMRYYLDSFCPLEQSNMLWTLTKGC